MSSPRIDLSGVAPTEPRKPREKQAPHTSFSQLTTYLRCSMQYYFKYVLGLRQRPRLYFANGKAGHKALEMNARHKIATGEDQPLEQMLATFSDTFDREVAELEPSDLKPGDNIGRTKDANIHLVHYFREAEAPLITPKTVELPFLIPLPPTEAYQHETPPVLGYVDAVNERIRKVTPRGRATARTSVDDWKFQQKASPQTAIDLSTQHDMYDLVLTRAGVPTDDLALQLMIPATKKEGPRLLPLYRSPELMRPAARAARHERVLYKLRTLARGIAAGIFIPTDNPQTCAGCGYREMCQYSLVKSDYEELQIRAAGDKP